MVQANPTGYSAGELVFYPDTVQARVYLSLINGNTSTPSLAAPAWNATTLYNPGDFVLSALVTYESIWPGNDNVGNVPLANPAYWRSLPLWDANTLYQVGATVIQDDVTYTSLIANNIGLVPWMQANVTAWQIQQPDVALGSWLLLDSSLIEIINPSPLYYPNNVFPLPNGFLRMAPQDPRGGSTSILGFPTNRAQDDWVVEGNYLVSGNAGPIVLRFAADVSDPSQFDPLFVEGFASRLAKEVCAPLTQSTEKLAGINADYKLVMGEARVVNAIEQGPVEPPLDDFIATRF